jgi:hypothetical protein
MVAPLLLVYVVLALAIGAGLFLAIASRGREARVLGPLLTAVRPRRALRALPLGLLAVAGILRLLAPEGLAPLWLDLALLAGAGLLVWLRPGFHDRFCGERGVRAGWAVLAFEQIEEWRLTGDHIRFRIQGEWSAADLPAERHVAMRERLEQLAPGRESRFRS